MKHQRKSGLLLLLLLPLGCRASVAAALGLSAGVFLIKHSRLAGSTDLDDWVKAAAATAKGDSTHMLNLLCS
jgi:hypothetical protein